MKHAVIIMIALLALGGVMAGCGRLGRTAEPTAIAPVELQLVTFDLAGPWSYAEESLLDQFQQLHPYVDFQRSAYAQAPSSYLAQTPAPDLMVIAAGYPLARAIHLDQVVDLTDVWEQSGLLEQYPPSFQALSAADGKQFYLPVGYTWSAIYYNQSVFDELGLQPPATWSEFTALCDTLLDNGITPLSIAGDDIWVNTLWLDYLDLRLNGAAFHRQLLSGEIAYTDERVRTVLDLWSWMFEQGYFMPHPERLSTSDSLMAIVSDTSGVSFGDKAAMTLSSPSWLGNLPPNLRQDLDFFAFPAIDPSVPPAEVLTTYGYMIPAAAQQRDVALAFVEFAGSAEAQATMAQHLSANAADLAPANAQADMEELPAAVRRGAELMTQAQDVTPFFVLGVPDSMWVPVGIAVDGFLRRPTDVAAFAEALESARQQALSAGDFITPE